MNKEVNQLKTLRDALAKADSGDKVVSEFAAAMQWFDSDGFDVLGKHRSDLKFVYIKLCLHKFSVNGWRFNECAEWSKHECSQFLVELKKVDRGEHAREKDRALAVCRLFTFVYGLKSPATQLYAFGMVFGKDAKLTDADINYYKACMEDKVEFNAKDAADAEPVAVADKVIASSGQVLEPNGYATLSIASRDGEGTFKGEVKVPFSIEGVSEKIVIPTRNTQSTWAEVPF